MSGRSTCPECGTILRIRDRSFVGRKVNCPECKIGLRVESADRNAEFVFRRLTAAELAVVTSTKQDKKSKTSQSIPIPAETRSFLSQFINSPMTAICLVGIAVTSLVAVLVLNPKLRLSSGYTATSPLTTKPSVESVSGPVDSQSNSESDVSPPSDVFTPSNDIVVPSITVNTPETTYGFVHPISALTPSNLEGSLSWPGNSMSNEPSDSPTTSVTPNIEIPVKIDVESKLAQRILFYKQPKISRRILIDALEEQIAVPIRYDVEELGDEDLEGKVTFELKNTTLKAVLHEVTESVGWQINIEDTGIRLTRKK